MKVTRNQVVAVVCFIVSSLLLVFAASCSVQKQATDDSEHKHIEEDSGEHQVDQEHSEKKGFVANVFCSACHYGFSDEKLARRHEQAGIGCERCHGESERHRSDEDNITPPEIMYPKAKINPTCMMCHPRHEIRPVKHHEQLLADAQTIFDPEINDSASKDTGHKMYCTTCHAKHHRINVRTIRWDKATGELLKE